MEVSDQLHALLIYPAEQTRYRWIRRLFGQGAGVEGFEKQKNLLLLPSIEPRIVHFVIY